MRQWTMCWVLLISVATFACSNRDQPPESAYDTSTLESARALAKIRAQEDEQNLQAQREQKAKAPKPECSRLTGGCAEGHICWDSHFCKQGFDDQCSAAGDKRCHKLCSFDGDCPEKMPHCQEKPIFSGSERGKLEKFCVQ